MVHSTVFHHLNTALSIGCATATSAAGSTCTTDSEGRLRFLLFLCMDLPYSFLAGLHVGSHVVSVTCVDPFLALLALFSAIVVVELLISSKLFSTVPLRNASSLAPVFFSPHGDDNIKASTGLQLDDGAQSAGRRPVQ